MLRRLFRRGHSQSNEAAILSRLTHMTPMPHTFVEFGFDTGEFNCIDLQRLGWQGLLMDGNPAKVDSALARGLPACCAMLTRENVRGLIEESFGVGTLGVLSIDVDGMDYWLLSELFPLQPAIIVCEYNASFLHEPVTVPYLADFERHARHPTGWYHGASLIALTALCARHEYDLIAVSNGGQNAFFRRADLGDGWALKPIAAYRENLLRNEWSGTTAAQQWDVIRHLPLIRTHDDH